MSAIEQQNNRRSFLKSTGLLGASLLVPTINLASSGSFLANDNIHEFGKRDGFTGQIGILVSMMDWMRATVLRSVKDMSQKELDFLLDEDSNSIGAMLLHLGATERFYQIHTFDVKEWGNFDKKDTDEWSVASGLGNEGRKVIKGNPLSYYTDKLEKVREHTMNELKQRDDSWLMESTLFFGNQPTNNYCKWFHVVEHESNHNGQIKYIKSRIGES